MTSVQPRLHAALAGRYTLERELGVGGMATVYLAHDVRHKRRVALKVIREDLAAGMGAERFLREIELAAGLHHPNILPLYDSGSADGILYYTMPLVEGESLRERLKRDRSIPVSDALRITREVADALDYAHRHDVVHRDIKPENILLHEGHSLITDFGIGKALSAASAGETLTQIGLAVGTPAYMSPEQASGETDLDGRTDLYSLGCVLYEMLTGALPFTGATAAAVIVRRMAEPPPDVRARSRDIPAAVAELTQRLMATDPDQRFRTGAEVIRASSAASTPSPDATPMPPTPKPTSGKSVAVLPFANMSGPDDEFFSDGISEEIINALTQLPDLKVAARTSAFSFKGKNEDLRVVGEKLGVTTVLEGSIRRSGQKIRITAQLINVGDGYHLWSEKYDREITDIFAVQDEIAGAIASKLKVTLGTAQQVVRPATDNIEAYELYLKGRILMQQRGQSLRRGIDCLERAIELDPRYAAAMAALGESLAMLGHYGLVDPRTVMPRARKLLESAVALDPFNSDALSALALVTLVWDRDRKGAEAMWQRAIALNPRSAPVRTQYGAWFLGFSEGRFDDADVHLDEALRLDPLSAYVWAAASLTDWTSFRPGVFGRSEARARRALELDPDNYLARWSLQMALNAAGRYDESIAAGKAALALSNGHAWAVSGIAHALLMADRVPEARAVYDDLRDRATREFIPLSNIAIIAMYLGDTEEALSLFWRAIEQREMNIVTILPTYPFVGRLRELPDYPKLMAAIGWSTT